MLQQLHQYIWSYNACDPVAQRSHWRHFLQIMAVTARDFWDGMITLRAMGLVYTTLLAMVPLLAVSISVLKGFGVHDQLEPVLVQLLAPLGERSIELSKRIVEFVENMRIGLLGAVGLALLIYTAISLVQKIESAFSQTWQLTRGRNVMQRFSDYLSIIMVGPVLIFLAFAVTASLGSHQLIEALNLVPVVSDLLRLIGKLIPYLLVIAAFTFIYVLVPNTRVELRSAFYGAVIAGVLWETSGVLFRSFVSGSTNYTAIYSSFAILLVFMIWLYLCWAILLIGASISYYHQHPESLKWKRADVHLSARSRDQLALQSMVSIARAHEQQIELVTTLESLAAHQQVPQRVLQRLLNALEDDGLLERTADLPSHYLPARSTRRIKLFDILRSARLAEDDGQGQNFLCDQDVEALLDELDAALSASLGEKALADLVEIANQDSAVDSVQASAQTSAQDSVQDLAQDSAQDSI